MSFAEQAEDNTGIGPARRSANPGSELPPWTGSYEGYSSPSSEPERDLYSMASSVRLYSFQISPEKADPGDHFSGDRAGRDRFLSERDRQYIKALVVMGYRDEALWLVRKAYASRRQERDAARAREERRLGRPVLLTRFDLDYLETLLLVGDRRNALDLFLRAMDDYEPNGSGTVAPRACDWAMLEREYREAIEAIESGRPFTSSPGRAEAEPARTGTLRSLFGRLFRLKSRPRTVKGSKTRPAAGRAA